MGGRAVGEPLVEAGIRVVVTAVVPMELLLGPGTAAEIAEQSWPEFRRALQAAILSERVRMGRPG
jgi:hypothetical protein